MLRYSPNANAILAEHNNVAPDFMARVWPVASNAHMHEWIEALGAAKAAGKAYRDGTRLLSMRELAA